MMQIVMHMILIMIDVKYVWLDTLKIMMIFVKKLKRHFVKMDKLISKLILDKMITN